MSGSLLLCRKLKQKYPANKLISVNSLNSIIFVGEIYESKEESCSNLIHWMPYSLLNEDKDVTNFFSRDKASSKKYACKSGSQCLHKSPAYSKLGKINKFSKSIS